MDQKDRNRRYDQKGQRANENVKRQSTRQRTSTTTTQTRTVRTTTHTRTTTTHTTRTVKRIQNEPLRAKKAPKAKKISNLTIEDVVKKVTQVSHEVKEGLQGAMYYIGVTLEQAKEREELEEREDAIVEEVVINTNQKTKKTTSRTKMVSRKKKTWIQKWCDNLKNGKRFEWIVTAWVALLVVCVGIGMVVQNEDINANIDDKNPILGLIDIMDFENWKDKTDKEETNEIVNPDIRPVTPNTGITGNYTIKTASGKVVDIARILCPEWIDRQFLTVNQYSRPGTVLKGINSIVIHYVGNPGTTAQNNRDYFESLKYKKESKSSHFVVGLDGEIIQCIPLNEISYASNHRNPDTISIEVCHPNADGKFTDVTYDAVIKLTAWLCKNFYLTEENIIRHHDVTGKNCPKYFVDHEDEWEQFKKDVMIYMEELDV